MWLKVRILNVMAGGPLIIALHTNDANTLDADALDRVRVHFHDKNCIALVDVAYGFVQKGEIGLFLEVASELDVKENDLVDVTVEHKPASIAYIRKKLDHQPLSRNEIDAIINDIVANKLSEVEMAYFVAACYTHRLSLDEVFHLIEAIVHFGGTLTFKKKPILDVHSIGGIPGNRTSMIVVPIIAAAGFTIPKTSTRSITSASGTSDTMEVFAPVAHSKEKIETIVKATNGCLVWGGTLDLASADDKLIKIERPLSLDPEGILLASIIAKKKAAGATHVLLEIPVGNDMKMQDTRHARALADKFRTLGKRVGIDFHILITDGTQPVGKGVGPALEARDVLLVLEGRGPEDLRDRSLLFAAQLLAMAGVKNAEDKARSILHSGIALEKFREIVKAQGGNPTIQLHDIKIGTFTHTLLAEKTGKVRAIQNRAIARLARMAGAPHDKGAGVEIHVKIGDRVKKGQLLLTVYAENKEKLTHATETLATRDVVGIK